MGQMQLRRLAVKANVLLALVVLLAGGVVVQACVTCADTYRVSDNLREMGIEVKPMGQPRSEMLNGDREVLTF